MRTLAWKLEPSPGSPGSQVIWSSLLPPPLISSSSCPLAYSAPASYKTQTCQGDSCLRAFTLTVPCQDLPYFPNGKFSHLFKYISLMRPISNCTQHTAPLPSTPNASHSVFYTFLPSHIPHNFITDDIIPVVYIYLPQINCKLHNNRDLCFSLISIYAKHLEQCLKHTKH